MHGPCLYDWSALYLVQRLCIRLAPPGRVLAQTSRSSYPSMRWPSLSTPSSLSGSLPRLVLDAQRCGCWGLAWLSFPPACNLLGKLVRNLIASQSFVGHPPWWVNKTRPCVPDSPSRACTWPHACTQASAVAIAPRKPRCLYVAVPFLRCCVSLNWSTMPCRSSALLSDLTVLPPYVGRWVLKSPAMTCSIVWPLDGW